MTQINNHTKQDAGVIKKQTSLLNKAGLGGLVVMLLLNLIMFWMINSDLKQLGQVRDQASVLSLQSQDLIRSSQFLGDNVNLDLLTKVIPKNKEDLAEFVIELEALAKSFGYGFGFKFASFSPNPKATTQSIQFTTRLTSNKQNLSEYLATIEKLPYLIEVVSLELTEQDTNNQIWQLNITAKIFVIDNFDQI